MPRKFDKEGLVDVLYEVGPTAVIFGIIIVVTVMAIAYPIFFAILLFGTIIATCVAVTANYLWIIFNKVFPRVEKDNKDK